MKLQKIRNQVSGNLGLFLVFGLLAGMALNHLAYGVLGGLLFHLLISNLSSGKSSVEMAETANR